MKKIFLLIAVVISFTAQSQTDRAIFHSSNVSSYDTNALSYLTAVGGLTTLEKNTINNFVLSAKSHGYWTKLKVINWIMGSTAAQHAYNLKDTSLFKATYSGTITHTSQHMVGNGTTGYVNTGLNLNTVIPTGYATMAVWVRNNSQGTYCVMGAISATNRYTQIYPWFGNTFYGQMCTNNSISESNFQTSSAGLSLVTRTGSTSAYIQRNGTQTTGFTTATAVTNNNIYVLAQNSNGSAANFTPYQVSMYMVADAFTTTEAVDFYNDCQTVITALGR